MLHVGAQTAFLISRLFERSYMRSVMAKFWRKYKIRTTVFRQQLCLVAICTGLCYGFH